MNYTPVFFVRMILTAGLLYCVYRETGIWTTITFALITWAQELDVVAITLLREKLDRLMLMLR